MYKTFLFIVTALLVWSGPLSAQQKTSQLDRNGSTVGIYLETVTHDPDGNLWVGGSVWLLQGLLLRINSGGVQVITPPRIQTVHRLLFTSKTVAWMIADNRVLYKSSDAGQSWREVLKADSNLTDIAFANRQSGWVVGWHGIIYHTANAGITWQKQTSGADIDLKQVVFVDAEHGWAMGADMLVATTDGGQTWNSIGGPKLSLQSIAFVNVQTGWGTLVDEQNSSKLARTNDGGATWITQSTPTPFVWDSVLFLNENEGWVSGRGIIHTSDRGQSWHYQRIPRADLSYERISFAGRKDG